ncbi:MAG: histidine phosphatase family protein [Dehalococcoidia bacterium]
MRIIIVRHGETDVNKAGLALGRADVDLNDAGHWQAQQVARALCHEAIAAVYASPLRRAVATAEAIASQHGLPVVPEEGLIEMDIGQMDGLTFQEARQRYPDFMEAWLGREVAATAMPGGERLQEVQERAWLALERVRDRHPDGTAVAVTHNFVILCLLCRVLGVNLADFRHLRHSVAGVTDLEFRDDRVILVRMNDTCHLRSSRQGDA